MVDFINTNTNLITLLFSFVVAISTVFYSILTASLVKETKVMRKAQTEPELVVYVDPSTDWINIMNIHIKNIGNGPAKNIKFKVLKDYTDCKGAKISDNDYIKNGIRFLPPQADYCSLFDHVMGKDFSKTDELRMELNVSYENGKNKYSKEFIIDLSQYVGLIRNGENHVYKISKSLEKIENILEKMNRVITNNRIRVTTITENAAKKEERDFIEGIEKRRKEKS